MKNHKISFNFMCVSNSWETHEYLLKISKLGYLSLWSMGLYLLSCTLVWRVACCVHPLGRIGGPVKSERLVAKPGYICSRGWALSSQTYGNRIQLSCSLNANLCDMTIPASNESLDWCCEVTVHHTLKTPSLPFYLKKLWGRFTIWVNRRQKKFFFYRNFLFPS